jgi:rhodanese-related sulfurtransferase
MAEPRYAGDLTPAEAYRMLVADPGAVLVDVRTAAEWTYVGLPDLSSLGRTTLRAQWQSFPDGAPNPGFLDELSAAGVSTAAPVLFICRSGARSASAAVAATQAGYTHAYNVSDGFEGPLDETSHRGSRAGWKAAGLPWRQS